MTLSDVSLLIYAYNSGDKHHVDAKKWFEAQFNETGNLCFSWLTISGFLRIITTDTLFGNGFSTVEAVDFVDEWLRHPNVRFLAPTSKHFQIFRQLVTTTGLKGAKLTDAHIAALAIENTVTLATNDSDFRKFDGLKLHYPLH